MHFQILKGHISPGFVAEGRRDTQRVLVSIPKLKNVSYINHQQMFPILIPNKYSKTHFSEMARKPTFQKWALHNLTYERYT